MTTKVLTQEEISQLKNLEQKRSELIIKFGQCEFQFHQIELEKENLKKQTIILKQTEINLAKTLQEKYGEGSIDLAKGEFISSQ